MDPLTLKVLATLVQLHGANATLVSDNKGIDDLLNPVRGQIQNKDPSMVLARNTTAHHETMYRKVYNKWVSAQ
jgi:hypothetical protein